MSKARGVAAIHDYQPFVSNQVYYSLQARDAEYEIIPAAIDQGLGLLIWSPLAGGLLSGKYRRGIEAPAGSRQLTEWDEPPVRDQEGLYDIVEALVQIGSEHNVSAAQVALAWTLARPGVSSLIVGARTEEQLADNLAAGSLGVAARRRRGAGGPRRLPPLYPSWHRAASAPDRLSEADLTLIGPHL